MSSVSYQMRKTKNVVSKDIAVCKYMVHTRIFHHLQTFLSTSTQVTCQNNEVADVESS